MEAARMLVKVDPLEAVAIVEQQDQSLARIDDDAAEPAVEWRQKIGAPFEVPFHEIAAPDRTAGTIVRLGPRRRVSLRELLAGEDHAHVLLGVPSRHRVRDRARMGDPPDIDSE